MAKARLPDQIKPFRTANTSNQAVSNEATSVNGEAVAARDGALVKMQARLTSLRNELTQLPLPGDSPTCYAFGFNRPDDPSTPGQPEALTLTSGAAGSGLLFSKHFRAMAARAITAGPAACSRSMASIVVVAAVLLLFCSRYFRPCASVRSPINPQTLTTCAS